MNRAVLQKEVITNVAGDQERETRSRRFNLVEGLLVMTFVLFVLWAMGYAMGVMGKIPGVRQGSTLLLVCGSCYLLFISPFIHKDTLSSWGLGSPWSLWRQFKAAGPFKKLVLGAIVCTLFLALNYLNYHNWTEVADFFNFDKVEQLNHLDRSFPGILFVLAFGAFLSAVLVTFGIRYDNFISAFATAMTIALPLLALVLLGAVAQRGSHAFDGITLWRFIVGAFGYVFWGFVQQLLFSSFFGTRLRKAFGPSTAPGNGLPPARRPAVAVRFALAFALIGAPLAFIPLRIHFGAEAMPFKVFIGFAVALFIFGALYGHFYAKDRKRLLVATLSGSCFGLIHINSWGLVAVTFLLGIFLTYVFMVDRNRNLVALGFIHGLLGSSFGLFFSHGRSGALSVDYGVGPWNVDFPTWSVLVAPVLCMLAYLFFIRYYLKNIHEE